MRRVLIALLIAAALFTVACDEEPKSQEEGSKVTEEVAAKLTDAVPYPTAEMNDSLERRNLRERLLRFNDPDKIGYLYVINFGKIIGYYTINGKISGVNSQMTPTQQISDRAHGTTAFDSIGDDGSYGNNEGGDRGWFAFTTEGVMVESSLDFLYADAPLPLNVPLLNPDESPSNTSKDAG